MPFCSACGQSNRDDARFCEKCGNAMPLAAATPAQPAQPAHAPVAPRDAPVILAPATPATPAPSLGQWWSGLRMRYGAAPVAVLVAVGALVVGLVAYNLFMKPMDSSDYVAKAAENATAMQGALNTMSSAVSDFSNTGSAADTLSQADVQDLRDTIKQETSTFNKASSAIRALRPPSEYATTQSRLITFIDFVQNTSLHNQTSFVGGTAIGQTYGDVMTRYQSAYSGNQALSNQSAAAWTAFNKASNKLGVSSQGD